ncbi:MAG TPA: MFS transporter, partial [Polyangiaceae bacterium]
IIGHKASFALTVSVVVVWGLAFALAMPVRQAYMNGIIPSAQRATVLSFDNLMESAGGVFAQPALGRVADVAGYPAAYLVCAAIELTALPFILLARRENAASDRTEEVADKTEPAPPEEGGAGRGM